MAWETYLRIGLFIGVFAAVALAEWWLPRRRLRFGRPKRWTTNALIIGLDTALVRILVPSAVAGFAVWASHHQFGVMNWLGLPGWAAGLIGFLILDFTVYVAHWVAHMVPAFWAVHRLHHIDPDVDVTTAIRSHPFETLALLITKIAVVVAFGIPALCVVIFECVLVAATMFNHANLKIAPNIDRVLRWFIITPDMHHIHHSVVEVETNTNYGFNFSIWDRLFRTYCEAPEGGYDNLTLGLEEYQGREGTEFWFALKTPFRNQLKDRAALYAQRDAEQTKAAE